MKSIQRAIAARHEAIRNDEAKGFTLIELLVVVIIIGILAAIAIPVFLTQREAAWRASVESDLKNTALAVETFAVGNNGSVVGADAAGAVDVAQSPGNTVGIVVTAATQSYVITACNADLLEEATYDSATTGIVQDATGAVVWTGVAGC